MPKKPLFPQFHAWISGLFASNPEGCWEWSGRLNAGGYGIFSIDGKSRLAHRLSWEIHNGPIPEGLFICHHCDNPPCCNPRHLFLGTARDNTQDMLLKRRGKENRKDFCKYGHPLAGDNLYVYQTGGTTWRYCITCRRERMASYRVTNPQKYNPASRDLTPQKYAARRCADKKWKARRRAQECVH